jgi:predicted RNase H-like HicB family nuclease
MAKTAKILHFKVLIEQDTDGLYVGSVPELPGCYTQAKTMEELRIRLKEVIQLVLESDKQARNTKIKSPSASPGFFGIEDMHIQYA